MSDRFQTAADLSAELKLWLRRGRPRKRWWLWGAVGLCCATILLSSGAAWSWRQIQPESTARHAVAAGENWHELTSDDGGLRLRILVANGGDNDAAVAGSSGAVPSQPGHNVLRLECDVPPGMHLGVFWKDASGSWHVLRAVADAGPPAPTALTTSEGPRVFRWPETDAADFGKGPAAPQPNVGGRRGVEVIVACVLPDRPPQLGDVVSAAPESWDQLDVAASEVLVFNRQNSQRFWTRDSANLTPLDAVEAQALQRMQAGLRHRFSKVVGFAFSQRGQDNKGRTD